MKLLHPLNWRQIWYSLFLWLGTTIIGAIVVLPWFYLILILIVFSTTVYYFKNNQRNLKAGLQVSFFWFGVVLFLSLLEIIGPYYFNFIFYFSDLRNWLLFPLILLIPVIYSLILENNDLKVLRKKRKRIVIRLMH